MAEIILQDVAVNFPIYDAGSRSLKKRIMAASTGGRISMVDGRPTVLPFSYVG